jgi:hypothetical protein
MGIDCFGILERRSLIGISHGVGSHGVHTRKTFCYDYTRLDDVAEESCKDPFRSACVLQNPQCGTASTLTSVPFLIFLPTPSNTYRHNLFQRYQPGPSISCRSRTATLDLLVRFVPANSIERQRDGLYRGALCALGAIDRGRRRGDVVG